MPDEMDKKYKLEFHPKVDDSNIGHFEKLFTKHQDAELVLFIITEYSRFLESEGLINDHSYYGTVSEIEG